LWVILFIDYMISYRRILTYYIERQWHFPSQYYAKQRLIICIIVSGRSVRTNWLGVSEVTNQNCKRAIKLPEFLQHLLLLFILSLSLFNTVTFKQLLMCGIFICATFCHYFHCRPVTVLTIRHRTCTGMSN